jgi:nitroreductase
MGALQSQLRKTDLQFTMPIEEAMRTQRAIRRLKPPDPVDDALILRLLELATKAPTGGNRQRRQSS